MLAMEILCVANGLQTFVFIIEIMYTKKNLFVSRTYGKKVNLNNKNRMELATYLLNF